MTRPSRKSSPTRLTTTLQLQLQALSQGPGVLSKELPRLLANELNDLCIFWGLNPQTDLATLQKQVRNKLTEHFAKIRPYRGKPSAEGPRREIFVRSFQLGFNISFASNEQLPHKSDRQRLIEKPDPRGRKASYETAQRDLLFAYAEIEKQILATGFVPRVPVSAFASNKGASQANGVADGGELDNHAESGASRTTHPFWRRRRTLVLGALGAAVTLAVTTGVVFILNPQKTTDKTTPESLLRATVLSTGTDSAYGGIFPADLSAKASSYVDKLASLSKDADYEAVFQDELNDGAYAAGGIRVSIALEVLVDGEISLYDIKPVNVKREPVPLDTVILLSLGHGPNANIKVSLDQAVPVAMDVGSGQPRRFGAGEVMGLSKTEKGSIDAAFTAQTVAETFDIAISYEYQGKPYTQTLYRTSNEQPFRVAALMCVNRLQTPGPEVSADSLERLRALRYRKVVGLDPPIDTAGNYSVKTIDPNVFAERCY